jgi:hypothetical protein
MESLVTPSKLHFAKPRCVTGMFHRCPSISLLTPHPSLFARSPLTRRPSLFARPPLTRRPSLFARPPPVARACVEAPHLI